jgi:hypothetical protein
MRLFVVPVLITVEADSAHDAQELVLNCDISDAQDTLFEATIGSINTITEENES